MLADSELENKIGILRQMKKQAGLISEQQKTLEFEIKKSMADNSEVLNAAGKRLVTWKSRSTIILTRDRPTMAAEALKLYLDLF